MADWRYIARRIDGEFLDWDVPLSRDELRWDLSGPGSLKASVTPEYTRLRVAGKPIIEPWNTFIYAEADDKIRWGGIVTEGGFSGSRWTFAASGFTTYPHGMPYADRWSKIQMDPMAAVAEIWRHLQSYPDGNLGVTLSVDTTPVRLGTAKIDKGYEYQFGDNWIPDSKVGKAPYVVQPAAASKLAVKVNATETTITLTKLDNFGKIDLPFTASIGSEDVRVTARSNLKLTVVRGYGTTTGAAHGKGIAIKYAGYGTKKRKVADIPAEPYELNWWEAPDCGQEIDRLAEETPFDYVERPAWGEGNEIIHQVLYRHPRVGTFKDNLRFVQGENVSQVVEVNRSGDGFANNILGIGKGEGTKTVRSDYAVRDGRLRRVAVLTDKTVSRGSAMDARVRTEAEFHHLDYDISQITVDDHANARIGSWEVGDDIVVQAEVDWIGWVDIKCRITSWALVAENRAVLTLARSDSFRYAGKVE